MMLPWPLSLLLCSIISVSGMPEHDGDFKTLVLKELMSLKAENARLKERLTTLETKNDEKETTNFNSYKRQTPTQGRIAFTAKVSQHVKNLTHAQSIVFGSVVTNIGNHYDPNTGIFHVPVPGTYLLFANILSESHNVIETQIIVDGKELTDIYSGGYYYGSGSNLVIANLNTGSDVNVRVHGHYSTDMSVHCCWSTFSGYLIEESDGPLVVVG